MSVVSFGEAAWRNNLMNAHRRILGLLAAGLLAVPVAAQNPPEKPLASLADAVAKSPVMEIKNLTVKFAKDFGLPSEPDDLWAYQVAVKEGERTKWIFVRPRDSGRIDIFFSVTSRVGTPGSFYYHTTADGKLIRCTYADGKIHVIPNDKAQKGFETETAYWQKWMEQANSNGR